MTDDVLLVQPLLPTARGVPAFRAQFDGIFAAMPDLRGELLAWGEIDGGVLIDLALRGTLGGRPVELITCDRIVLRDGLMAERHARMDVLPLVRASMASPVAAWPLLRSLAGNGRGRAAVEAAESGRATSSSGAAGAHGRGAPRAEHSPERDGGDGLAGPLRGLAVGRLVLGAAGRLAPHATARAFRADDPDSAELAYMTRVFGARAIALGSGYLLSRGEARRTWQRLALGVDVADTIAGVGHLRRRDIAAPKALALTALTGAYAAIGAARLARDLAG